MFGHENQIDYSENKITSYVDETLSNTKTYSRDLRSNTWNSKKSGIIFKALIDDLFI